ncbi:Lrp/AsnC family transcriptional regulator [Cryobacterium sp.]|uniref:Lrp/AsnC family transcriptional regulator n=1 Tax=Cryobacterium sp. TaxID=1926290 RepID=UPI002619B8EC|nr:Lrp/AsnC family transcriptional regulator [Cryobacterium sp.]
MHRLDKVDLELLRALCADPHSSYVGLAHTLGLSRNTVQTRMSRLEDARVFLDFDRRISLAALGHPLTAFIEVYIEQKRTAEIITRLTLIPEIVQAHGMSGAADLLVRVACADAEDLFRVDRTILACDGVERTETSLAMGELIPFRVTPLIERGLLPRA